MRDKFRFWVWNRFFNPNNETYFFDRKIGSIRAKSAEIRNDLMLMEKRLGSATPGSETAQYWCLRSIESATSKLIGLERYVR